MAIWRTVLIVTACWGVAMFSGAAMERHTREYRQEEIEIKIAGPTLAVTVLSPLDGMLAKDPALLLTFAGDRNMSLLKAPYCEAAADARDSTDACRELFRALVTANEAAGHGASLVEINLTDDAGHTMGAAGYGRGAQFLLERFGKGKAPR